MSQNPKDPQNPPTDLRKQLEESVDLADWAMIFPHTQRDGVVVVATQLSLVEVGVKLAEDDAATLTQWLEKSWVGKPSAVQLESWKEDPQRKFKILIVQPYVLIQEIIH